MTLDLNAASQSLRAMYMPKIKEMMNEDITPLFLRKTREIYLMKERMFKMYVPKWRRLLDKKLKTRRFTKDYHFIETPLSDDWSMFTLMYKDKPLHSRKIGVNKEPIIFSRWGEPDDQHGPDR